LLPATGTDTKNWTVDCDSDRSYKLKLVRKYPKHQRLQNSGTMDEISSKARTSELLNLLNKSIGDSTTNSRPRPVSQGCTTACLSPNDNDLLYRALTEALAISEEMERLMMVERGQGSQPNKLAQNHGSLQKGSKSSYQ
jgi:hypothetical protein